MTLACLIMTRKVIPTLLIITCVIWVWLSYLMAVSHILQLVKHSKRTISMYLSAPIRLQTNWNPRMLIIPWLLSCHMKIAKETHITQSMTIRLSTILNAWLPILSLKTGASAQHKYWLFEKYFKERPFKGKDPLISFKVISDTRVLVYKNTCLVIPTKNMQSKIVQWYYHYL